MNVAVLGSITLDTIIHPNRPAIRNLGGSLYNVLALASLTSATVCPVANLGEDIFDEVLSALAEYPNVVLDGLKRVNQPNIHCYLFFPTDATSQPTLVEDGSVFPITFSQAEPFLDSSMCLITFPTGSDLSLRTLKKISTKATCPIYLDYHILTHGRDSRGTCFLRKRRNWIDWVSTADFTQFNRSEAEHLWQKRMDTDEEALNFGRAIINNGVKAVMITFGKDGSKVIYKGNAGIVCKNIQAKSVPQIVDATGCGCVYSAGFVSHYLQRSNIPAACEFASSVASKKCSVSGISKLKKALAPCSVMEDEDVERSMPDMEVKIS